MDKIFEIYEQIVDMVQSFSPFTLEDVEEFLQKELVKYAEQPFFPVLGGMYVNALINRLFEERDYIELDIQELCYKIIEDAQQHATAKDEPSNRNEIGFSLDLLGYLMHPNKKLVIIGPVGDYAGALMGENSTLIIHGMHGKHLGYEKAESAEIIVEEE